MQVEIKSLTKNNLQDMYQISKEQFNEECWTLEQFESTIKDKQFTCFMLYVDNKPASFIIWQNLVDSLNLLLIATKQELKNNGFASQLINLFLTTANKLKIKAWLEVKANNYTALTLYRKLSFTELYTRKKYYPDGSDAIIFEFQK